MELINTANTFVHDALIGGSEIPAMTKVVTVAQGAGNLVRGTVLGEITTGATTAESAAKSGGNTGNGTLTLDETTPVLAGVQAGIYKARVIRKALAQVGTTPAVPAQKALVEFSDPNGNVLEVFDLATTPGNTIANQLKFVMVEGATPFEVGDGFDITVSVAAGSGYFKKVNSANTDGSAVAKFVLAQAVDATSGNVKALVYETGLFNATALVFGGTDDAEDHREALRQRGIFLTTEQ